MKWSAAELRAFHRHPEAHPRRAVEFGRIFGGLLAAHHADEGILPTSALEDLYGSAMANLPAVDSWLAEVLPTWQSLFLFWVIRGRFAARYGPAAVGGFDAGADDIYRLLRPELIVDEDGYDDQTPRTLTDWFRRLDGTLQRVRESGWLNDHPQMEHAQTFCVVALSLAPESPMRGEFDAPERERWNEQLGMHVGWLSLFAPRVGRIRAKELVRQIAREGSAA